MTPHSASELVQAAPLPPPRIFFTISHYKEQMEEVKKKETTGDGGDSSPTAPDHTTSNGGGGGLTASSLGVGSKSFIGYYCRLEITYPEGCNKPDVSQMIQRRWSHFVWLVHMHTDDHCVTVRSVSRE